MSLLMIRSSAYRLGPAALPCFLAALPHLVGGERELYDVRMVAQPPGYLPMGQTQHYLGLLHVRIWKEPPCTTAVMGSRYLRNTERLIFPNKRLPFGYSYPSVRLNQKNPKPDAPVLGPVLHSSCRSKSPERIY